MIYGTFILAILGEIALPFGIILWLKRHHGAGVHWRLFGVGVLTFIVSQMVHIPLLAAANRLLMYQLPPYDVSYTAITLDAVMLGLLAGLCEETARLAGYLILKGKAKAIAAAMALGAGHGGIESIAVGLSLLFTFVVSLLALHNNQTLAGVTPQSASAVFAYPWYIPLISLFERLTAVSLHIMLSVMVWQAVIRRTWTWFVGAVLYHALVDALSVALPLLGVSTYLLEGILGVFMLGNLAALYLISRRTEKLPVRDPGVEIPE
jgi:uncharacterized membrane protein YhfC